MKAEVVINKNKKILLKIKYILKLEFIYSNLYKPMAIFDLQRTSIQ